MDGATLTLMSVTERHLLALETLARRLAASNAPSIRIRATLDRRTALAGADFVIVAIAVGGIDAWEADLEVPARFGIFKTRTVCRDTLPSAFT